MSTWSRNSFVRLAMALGLIAVLVLVVAGLPGGAAAAPDASVTLVVTPINTNLGPFEGCGPISGPPYNTLYGWSNSWFTCNEGAFGAPGSITLTKDQPRSLMTPLDVGSAKFDVQGSTDGPYMFTGFQPGLALDEIDAITYDTYFATGAGSGDRPVFSINVDYDLTDASTAWQGRLVWIPNWAGCTTLTNDTWQTHDPINNVTGCWLQTGTPIVGDSPGTAVYPLSGGPAGTWAQILAAYPNAGIGTTSGEIGFKIGSGHSATETYLDKLVVTVAGNTTTWNFEPAATVSLVPSDPNNVCDTNTVDIKIEDVSFLWGYTLKVNYVTTNLNSNGAFVDTWFDTNQGQTFSPITSCNDSAGICEFYVVKLIGFPYFGVPTSGTGVVAKVDLTPQALAEDDTVLSISNLALSDKDGQPIAVNPPVNLNLDVCGLATVTGQISLQGRTVPIDSGTVTLSEQDGNGFGTYGPVSFDTITGFYSIPNVKYLPGGTTYKFDADSVVYLPTTKNQVVNGNLTGQSSQLPGGDATDNDAVDNLDLSCVGGDFGGTGVVCGTTGYSDLNKDGNVNIQDLSLVGANYGKSGAQGW